VHLPATASPNVSRRYVDAGRVVHDEPSNAWDHPEHRAAGHQLAGGSLAGNDCLPHSSTSSSSLRPPTSASDPMVARPPIVASAALAASPPVARSWQCLRPGRLRVVATRQSTPTAQLLTGRAGRRPIHQPRSGPGSNGVGGSLSLLCRRCRTRAGQRCGLPAARGTPSAPRGMRPSMPFEASGDARLVECQRSSNTRPDSSTAP
jgi:hypothetical protein